VHARIGDTCDPGSPLFTVRFRDADQADHAQALLESAITWHDHAAPPSSSLLIERLAGHALDR